MTTKSKILLGIVGAAAAGVVIGLLIAPEKGSDIRKKIKNTAGSWADNLTHLFERGKAELADLQDEAKQKGRSAKASAEDKVNKLKESLS